MDKTSINSLVLDILGWTEEQYCEYQFESGMKQIATILSNEEDARTLSYNKEFWTVFKQNWNNQDDDFILSLRVNMIDAIMLKGFQCPKEVTDMYKNFHGDVAFYSLPVYVQKIINQHLYREQKVKV